MPGTRHPERLNGTELANRSSIAIAQWLISIFANPSLSPAYPGCHNQPHIVSKNLVSLVPEDNHVFLKLASANRTPAAESCILENQGPPLNAKGPRQCGTRRGLPEQKP